MRVAGIITDPINPYFENIFETGVDEMSWDDLSKNDMMWPSVREVTRAPNMTTNEPPFGLNRDQAHRAACEYRH